MISKVTKNDFNESDGNRKLQAELEKNRRIKTYFYENDKTPNTDGYFEVLGLQGAAMKRFVVQIKTVRKMTRLKNGYYSYSADTTFFHYVLENIDQNPAIFFVVDLSKGTIYYKLLSLRYLLSLKFRSKKKITLHLGNSDILREEKFYDFCMGLIRKMEVETSRMLTRELLPDANELFQNLNKYRSAGDEELTWDSQNSSSSIGFEEGRMLRIPTAILDKYQDIQLLGRGGQSSVYSITSKLSGSKAALKIAPITNQYARPLLSTFQLMDRLRHPGIPRVHDYFSDDKVEYMIMDLIEGRELTKLISYGALNLVEIIAIIAELCDVVNYVYLNDVIHRDIKPSNIMVDQSHSITLIDFDMVARINESFPNQAFIGTLKYAAPEVYSPDYKSNIACTIFSIGATLYYSLRNKETQKYLSSFISPFELCDYIKNYTGKELGYGLVILKRALAFDPEKRYESVLEMKEDLMIWQKKEYFDPSELNSALARSRESYYKENFHK